MAHSYFCHSLATFSLLLMAAGVSQAQSPVIAAVLPLANAVAPTAPLTVSFNQLLAAGAVGCARKPHRLP